MSTDPAVTAAAEALNGPGSSYLIERGHLSMTDAEAAVAAARPIIEAEVRERIAVNDVLAHCPHHHPDDLSEPEPCGDCIRLSKRIARGTA